MQYTTEDLSPVKKKLIVTVPAEEGEAAIASTIAMYRTSMTLDGFRKGKVPASIIEKRFGESIYREATTELVNVHINEIVGEGSFKPISRIDFDGGELERGKDFVYSISFEVMPEFTIPQYEGMEIEQEEAVLDEAEVDRVVERLRNSMAEITDVKTPRKAEKGDIAIIDFVSFDEKGAPIEGISANGFQLSLGEGQTLEDFENLVYTLQPGEETEGPVTFPQDFFNPEFAGKTITMKVKLLALKERNLPEMTDELAKKAGNFDSVEKLRESIGDSYLKSKTELFKAEAEKKLLDELVAKLDFTLPESMLNDNINMMIGEIRSKQERMGKSLESLGKTEEELREEVRPEAENRTRIHVFLMTVANACGLTVNDQEIDMALHRIAMQSGQNFDAIKDYYTQNNLTFLLRDRILADKAMEEIYSKVKVTLVKDKTDKAEPSAE